ncbi:hypothetical protein PO909_008518 [Leuciscus waleckii]
MPWSLRGARAASTHIVKVRGDNKGRMEEPDTGPTEKYVAVVSTLPEILLGEPVSRDWPLDLVEQSLWCPEAANRQGTTELTVLRLSSEDRMGTLTPRCPERRTGREQPNWQRCDPPQRVAPQRVPRRNDFSKPSLPRRNLQKPDSLSVRTSCLSFIRDNDSP